MDNLTHNFLGCRRSMLFYDARRSEFLKELRDETEKLVALMKRCGRYLRYNNFEELRRTRAEMNPMEEEAICLVMSFESSKKQQSDRIKELLGEDRTRMSTIFRSEVNYFVDLKKNDVERLRREKAEEILLVEEFRRLSAELYQLRTLWYDQDQDDAGKQSVDVLSWIFLVDQVEKKLHKEQPWYEIKED